MTNPNYVIRPATTADVRAIQAMRKPLEDENGEAKKLLHHDLVGLYEKVQEFSVVEGEDGEILGAGALHVMWEDLAEIRSLIVAESARGKGIGHAIVAGLLERAKLLGIRRVFCLTFEVHFFGSHGFEPISDVPVDEETYAEMVRSTDDGIAEFLDLARVKQNTLGNTRMLRVL